MIIDDMLQAQEALASDLKVYCPQVEVCGRATGVVSAAKMLKNLSPDLVFLDIELEDGTGFDLLEILPQINFKIIFTTASDQHAIRAFRFSAIDYLLKPIDANALKEAVAKVGPHDSPANVEILLDRWAKPEERASKIALHSADKIEVVEIQNIVRCESENNYTMFYFADGAKSLVSKTLKSFESMLTTVGFVRVHQSHLVNVQHIKAYIKTEGGYLMMRDGARVPVAVRKKALVIQMLEGIS